MTTPAAFGGRMRVAGDSVIVALPGRKLNLLWPGVISGGFGTLALTTYLLAEDAGLILPFDPGSPLGMAVGLVVFGLTAVLMSFGALRVAWHFAGEERIVFEPGYVAAERWLFGQMIGRFGTKFSNLSDLIVQHGEVTMPGEVPSEPDGRPRSGEHKFALTNGKRKFGFGGNLDGREAGALLALVEQSAPWLSKPGA